MYVNMDVATLQNGVGLQVDTPPEHKHLWDVGGAGSRGEGDPAALGDTGGDNSLRASVSSLTRVCFCWQESEAQS